MRGAVPPTIRSAESPSREGGVRQPAERLAPDALEGGIAFPESEGDRPGVAEQKIDMPVEGEALAEVAGQAAADSAGSERRSAVRVEAPRKGAYAQTPDRQPCVPEQGHEEEIGTGSARELLRVRKLAAGG